MNRCTRQQQREGSAILIAMFFMVMGVSVVGIFISYSLFEADLTRRSIDKEKARVAAESALDYGLVQLKDLVMYNQLTLSQAALQSLLDAETGPTPTGDFVFTGPNGEDGYKITVETAPVSGVVTQGTVALGAEATYEIFTITAGARNPNTGNSVVLKQSVQAVGLPLIRYGVFYQDDLEMNPGPNMDMYGPVHCNANIYMSPGAALLFHDRLTSYGDMYRHRKDDTNASTGTVGIDNTNNVEVDMTIDSTSPNWMTQSIQNWGGRVLSKSHGVAKLSPPIAAIDNPHDIIERGLPTNDVNYHVQTEQEKYANKACLIIRVLSNGTFTAKDYFGVDKTTNFHAAMLATTNISGQIFNIKTNGYFRFYSNTVSGAVSNGSYSISQTNFYDEREGCFMRPVDIYVNELVREFPGLTNTLTNTYSISQGRGVVYVTRDDPDGAGPLKPCVRIRNGSQLPVNGLTIASDTPVYIEGNYNITNVATAFVAGDAVSELSTAWQDARSQATLTSRIPSNTSYNVVLLTGNSPTSTGIYNGGLENVMRFLEDWSTTSKTVTFRGSIIDLWFAQIAIGPWIYGSPVYNAPTRNYGYDTIYRTQVPPGMTRVFGLEPTGWGQTTW